VLILFAITILAIAILSTNNGIVGTAALVLFLVAFVRIFRDYVKHLKRSRKKRPRTNRRAGESDARPHLSGAGKGGRGFLGREAPPGMSNASR